MSVDLKSLPAEIREHYAAMPWQRLEIAKTCEKTIEVLSSAGHGYAMGRQILEVWTLFSPVMGHRDGLYVMTDRDLVEMIGRRNVKRT